MWRKGPDFQLAMLESIDRRLAKLGEDMQDVQRRLTGVENVRSAKLSKKAFWLSVAFAAFGPAFAVLWNTVIK